MERIVQKLNSPMLKRKSLIDRNRNFGVPLKCLLYKKSILVPRIVENICEFILTFGLQTEGIFRVNGSTKTIASLKTQFDVTSADDLNESDCEDIHAICGVFKLFLREIPDGLIPDAATRQIVKIMDQLKDEKPQCLLKLRNVVIDLPEENYNLVRYVCHFLRELVANEGTTKMSAANLGIVFGPCLFKCGLGIQGLRQQNLSNLATTYFITHFDIIFSTSPSPNSPSGGGLFHQHLQLSLLKSAASLNSLLQRRRQSGVPRHSMVTAASTEEAMVTTSLSVSRHVEGSQSRPITPGGDTASPLLSPSVGNNSCMTAHSASSLSLSHSRKWCYSDAEELDLGSHGALARELASIMTSISIPSVSKLVQPVDSTPTSTSTTRKPLATMVSDTSSPSSRSTEPIKESLDGQKDKPSPPLVIVEDLAKSMPSLVHPYQQHQRHNHNYQARQHNPQNHRAWRGRRRELGEDGEKVSSSDSSSSATSLLEIAFASSASANEQTIPQILTESNTETTTQTLTIEDEYEPYHAYLSSSIVDGFHLAQHPTFVESDSEGEECEENQVNTENRESEKKQEAVEASGTSAIPAHSVHHFPRSKFRPPNQYQESSNRLHHGVVNCLVQGADDAALSEFSTISPRAIDTSTETAIATMVSPTQDHHLNSAVISNSAPRVLIGNPVCQCSTPRPHRISTWPRKRNILSLLHNRRSLDVCIRLNGRRSKTEEVPVSKAESGPQAPNLTLDSLNFPDVLDDLEASGFLTVLTAVLESRRKECRRPEDLEKMSSSELAQEKLDLQKCLLYFEKAKGRPSDLATKRTMKPLYDRYRCVRRMVRMASTSAVRLSRGRSSGSAPRPSADIPKEDTQPSTEVVSLAPEPGIIPESSTLPEATVLLTSSTNFSHSEATDPTASLMSNPSDSFFLNWELTLLEFTQMAKVLEPKDLARGRGEILSMKHKLQRFLYNFEKRIQESTNRPPSKHDRDGFRNEYNRYRDCKQRLYVIDQFLERPQTSPESLILDAQTVGRAHRRRRVIESGGGELIQQKVATATKNSSADAAIA
ncbi:hypothetical protein Aperf_G00000103566 [Anoplocephala perfoliata]